MDSFRGLREEDVEQVVELIDDSFQDIRTKDGWVWKHAQNPGYDAERIVVADVDGRIRGLTHYHFRRVKFFERPVNVWVGGDGCVDKNFRGKKVFDRILREIYVRAKSEDVDFIYGFNMPDLFPRVYEKVGELQVYSPIRVVKFINYEKSIPIILSLLNEYLGSRLGFLVKLFERLRVGIRPVEFGSDVLVFSNGRAEISRDKKPRLVLDVQIREAMNHIAHGRTARGILSLKVKIRRPPRLGT
jgi:predicted N-acetyltransferase YhbS